MRYLFSIVILVCVAISATGQKPRTRRAAPSRVAASRSAQPKFKAIFEPVNYDQDVKLFSVHCADEKNCWAAGGTNEIKGGLILHTSDAGDHWTVQAGDPQSADRAFRDLNFTGDRQGFAIQRTGQASNLYRTDDGEHWLPVGKIAEHIVGYHFSSATSGIAAGGSTIELTQDAGQNWTRVFTCAAKVTVKGLARNAGCSFMAVSFPSTSTGYVAATSHDTDENLFLAKTTDGGTTWNLLTLDVHNDHPGPENLCFIDDSTGFMRVGSGDTGKIYRTTDGGRSWTALAPSAGDAMRFSDDKRAGWAFRYTRMGYSADGGEHWSSRQVSFPATPWDSSLPRSNFGMVVGEHGMAYRYRIVPFNYSAKGMLEAPLLSSGATK